MADVYGDGQVEQDGHVQAVADQIAGDASTTDIVTSVVENPEQKTVEQKDARMFDEATLRQMMREEAQRVAQSLTDKATDRINKAIRDRFEALDKNQKVLGLSDEQLELAKRKIVDEERYALPEAEKANPADRPAIAAEQPEMHPVIATALDMMAAEQMMIEEGDPEFAKYLKPLLGGAEVTSAFLTAAARAMDAKKTRLEAQKENAAARSAGGAAGRTVPGNDISSITDSKTLYLMGEKTLRGK